MPERLLEIGAEQGVSRPMSHMMCEQRFGTSVPHCERFNTWLGRVHKRNHTTQPHMCTRKVAYQRDGMLSACAQCSLCGSQVTPQPLKHMAADWVTVHPGRLL